MKARFRRLAVLGLGLLGGSVAAAARERDVAETVVGFARRPEPLVRARERGLVDEIVNAEELLDRACEVAERFAAIGPASFRMTKRQLRQPALDRIGAGIEEMDPEIEEIWKDRATHKAIRRYVQETLGK